VTETVHALDAQDAATRQFSILLTEDLRVSVPNLFSAGYRWDVVSDDASLEVVRQPSQPAPEDAGVGSAPPIVFAVKALAAGEHSLALELRRPWEDAPARKLALRIAAHRPTILDGLRPH
jgi:predicted secreted protein